jgi:hypothetical protein
MRPGDSGTSHWSLVAPREYRSWITLPRKVDVRLRQPDFAAGNVNLLLNTSAVRQLSFVT